MFDDDEVSSAMDVKERSKILRENPNWGPEFSDFAAAPQKVGASDMISLDPTFTLKALSELHTLTKSKILLLEASNGHAMRAPCVKNASEVCA